jgi:hypothetical protein
MLLFQAVSFLLSGIKIVSVKDDATAESGNIQVFDGGGARGHDDGGGDFQLAGGIRDTLRMVS